MRPAADVSNSLQSWPLVQTLPRGVGQVRKGPPQVEFGSSTLDSCEYSKGSLSFAMVDSAGSRHRLIPRARMTDIVWLLNNMWDVGPRDLHLTQHEFVSLQPCNRSRRRARCSRNLTFPLCCRWSRINNLKTCHDVSEVGDRDRTATGRH